MRKLLYIFFVVLTAILLKETTFAQNTTLTLHIAYKATNFAPQDYLERALPPITRGSFVEISLTIFKEYPDKTIVFETPSSYIYQWWDPTENNPIAQGRGVSKINITIPENIKSNSKVILLRLYNIDNKFIGDFKFELPIGNPEVAVINQNNKRLSISQPLKFTSRPNSNLIILAKPLFFTVPQQSLNFSWAYEGKQIFSDSPGEPNKLKINIPENPPELNLFSVKVSNIYNEDEVVFREFNVFIK
jgi:hypothetical protein